MKLKKLLYVEIAEQIMLDAFNGDIIPGAKISSVREMALKYKVNPKTIQKAFDYLSDKGIFISIIGDGRYLSSDENVLLAIKEELVNAEIEIFVQKMQNFDFDLNEIIMKIKEQYE